MERVNIGDIEQLVLAKVNIEKKLKEEDENYEAMDLGNFVSKYIILDKVLVYEGEVIPFAIRDIGGTKWLMYTTENAGSLDILEKNLSKISYDMSSLRKIPYSEMVMKLDTLKSYYMVGTDFYVE